ncbi:glycoside hydrolase family 47 protein [Sphingomonas sp. ASV193]|uniref:glycoside hydrolase family 47 protein n=1 Tax=Sphingomonas sp. ASV193 TaxID=3144405 RepID=UPI0032E8EBFF
MPTLPRRALLQAGLALPLAHCAPLALGSARPALAGQVRDAMRWAWREYRRLAWGKDEIRPVSGTFSSFPLKDRHLGLSLVEALDTLWLMALDREFDEAADWAEAQLDFDVDGTVSVFETNIRLVGGLLSGWHVSGRPRLLALARDLADRLMPAFAASPLGIPHRFVNLKTGAVSGPVTNPAEAGTILPEFGFLSRAVGDDRYRAAAKRAQVALFERRSAIGLIPDAIDATTGEWKSRRATVGPPSDSYYEYLWDGWDLLGDRDCRAMYRTMTDAILRHQRRSIGGHRWFVDVDYETGAMLTDEQDELSSFYGGLLGQSGDGAIGGTNVRAWSWLQGEYGILPEGFKPASGTVTYKTNALRPELADAAFNLWLLDGREEWRDIVAAHFANMLRWNRAPHGFTDMADVTAAPKRQADHCPGYWWSEQMKYYWLAFSASPRVDYRRLYLSTEGNILRGVRRPA